MKSKIIILLVIGSLIAASAPGCNLLKKRVEKKERVTYKVAGNNKTRLVIDNLNGEINVTKSDDTIGTVIIGAEKIAKVKADDLDKPLDNIKINIDTSGIEIHIKTLIVSEPRGLFNKGENSKVNYELRVPANIKVDIDNTNGSVILTAITNDIKVETTNGRTTLNKCSGNIVLEGVNGDVYGNFDSLKSMNIDVVNGAVKLGGFANISAQLNASTVNGKVKYVDLMMSNLTAEKRSLSGTLGTGKSIVKVTTTNGSITFNAKDISLAGNKHVHDEFEGIKFDLNFDDDDNFVKDKKKDTAKTLEPVKEQVTPKVPDTPKTK